MTSGNLPNLADLPRGHEFPEAGFLLAAADIRSYIEAVDDRSGAYGQAPEGPAWAPPLAIAALALRTILQQVELSAGAVHAGQEVEFRRAVPVGASLRSRARVAQRSEMRGTIVSVIEFDVEDAGSHATTVVGRATVMTPQAEAPS